MDTQDGRPEIFGVRFDNVTVTDAAARAKEMVRCGTYQYCVGTNANLLRMARRDAGHREAVNGADLSLADGAGVIWAARILNVPLVQCVPCIDLLDALLPMLDGQRVYILGGKPGAAEQAREHLSARYPKLTFCGTHHGYFQDPEQMAAEISDSEPELLLVCLGSPKQECFMARYGNRTGARLAVGCGGWIDIAAGRLRRAPLSWRRHSMEWAWRLVHEPWRIGRVCGSLLIPLLAMGERVRRQHKRAGGSEDVKKT